MTCDLPSEEQFINLISKLEQSLKKYCRENVDWSKSSGRWSDLAEQLVYEEFKKILVSSGYSESVLSEKLGNKFPDYTIFGKYGIEVKTAKRKKSWVTIGNSVLEGTRVPGVASIYLVLFKSFEGLTEVRIERYESCLSDFTVTHSPRYKIDLDTEITIHEKMGTTYDEFADLEDPRSAVVSYIRESSGGDSWFSGGEDESYQNVADARLRFFDELSTLEKKNVKSEALLRFPLILKRENADYKPLSKWLVTEKGIINNSLRDMFSAGGDKLNKSVGVKVRRKIDILIECFPYLICLMENVAEEYSEKSWGFYFKSVSNLREAWRDSIYCYLSQREIEIIESLFREYKRK